MDDLKIHIIPSRKDKIKQPKLSELHMIPKINSPSLFIGSQGSGKSNLMVNLLTRKDFLRGAFDRIFLISPTARTDDILKFLDIDDSDIIDNIKEAANILSAIHEYSSNEIARKGPVKAAKYLTIFEDIIGETEFMRTVEFTNSFIMCRHLNMTTMICSQSYKGIPRKCRLQARNIFYFLGSTSENECIAEDRGPPGLNKKESLMMITETTQEPFTFLYVAMDNPFTTRYRKNLDEIIDTSSFIGRKPHSSIEKNDNDNNNRIKFHKSEKSIANSSELIEETEDKSELDKRSQKEVTIKIEEIGD